MKNAPSLLSIFPAFLFLLLFGTMQSLSAQERTVGLIHNDPGSFNGYTLFSGLFDNHVYLIDNCGQLVNEWNPVHRSGVADYLALDGNLLRAAVDPTGSGTIFTIGGTGQRLQKLDWEGNIIWDWVYASNSGILHHDFIEMPNGNILTLAYEKVDSASAIAEGRDSALVSTPFIAPDVVLEVRPIGADSAEIVWEWHVWDHLIQDSDSSKPNFGPVEDHPELFDMNYYNPALTYDNIDWTHYNGIDYNAELDQIAISSQLWCEFIIIDHSTTTQEAASHSGGRYGKGGDVLYRWGNKSAIRQGTAEERQLWGPHGILWIPEEYPNGGKMMIYNNGNWRSPLYSEVFIIDPPQSAPGEYILENGYWGPESPEWIYGGPEQTDFYSFFISNATPQPNGNVLICEGQFGTFFEVTAEGREVWKYVNPMIADSILAQGDSVPSIGFADGNATFRIQRYAPDYPGFTGRDLSAGGFVERNPTEFPCQPGIAETQDFLIYPVPAENWLNVSVEEAPSEPVLVEVYSLLGQKVAESMLEGRHVAVEVSDFLPGHYIVRVGDLGTKKFVKFD